MIWNFQFKTKKRRVIFTYWTRICDSFNKQLGSVLYLLVVKYQLLTMSFGITEIFPLFAPKLPRWRSKKYDLAFYGRESSETDIQNGRVGDWSWRPKVSISANFSFTLWLWVERSSKNRVRWARFCFPLWSFYLFGLGFFFWLFFFLIVFFLVFLGVFFIATPDSTMLKNIVDLNETRIRV